MRCPKSRFQIQIIVFDELELIIFVSQGLTASLVLKVVELTGEDAEVICGEWETGYVQNRWRIHPACLPTGRSSSVSYHTGWSNRIPYHVLKKYAVGFTKVYRDFFKQIQYKMKIMDKCEDDIFLPLQQNLLVEYPTNTYYPSGIKL